MYIGIGKLKRSMITRATSVFIDLDIAEALSKINNGYRKLTKTYSFTVRLPSITVMEVFRFWFMAWFMVFNATVNNISAISWRSVLLVEETGVPGENYRPVASN